MKKFKTLNELIEYSKHQAETVLKNEIASRSIKVMQQSIESEVYSVYPDPVKYERLGYHGGLQDPDNIEIQVIDDSTISVENIRFDGKREVAEIVETGIGYQYDFEFNGIPRPFTEATRRELKTTDILKSTMKEGLEKRGVRTE